MSTRYGRVGITLERQSECFEAYGGCLQTRLKTGLHLSLSLYVDRPIWIKSTMCLSASNHHGGYGIEYQCQQIKLACSLQNAMT